MVHATHLTNEVKIPRHYSYDYYGHLYNCNTALLHAQGTKNPLFSQSLTFSKSCSDITNHKPMNRRRLRNPYVEMQVYTRLRLSASGCRCCPTAVMRTISRGIVQSVSTCPQQPSCAQSTHQCLACEPQSKKYESGSLQFNCRKAKFVLLRHLFLIGRRCSPSHT